MKTLLRPTPLKISVAVLIVIILVIRALAPAFILNKLNEKLATASPVYSMHIGGLHLGLLTFSYRFDDIQSFYKKTGEKFFDVKKVRVSLSFHELLHLRILTDVRVDEGRFVLTKALFNSKDEPDAKPKETTKKTADALFPVRIAVVEIHKSAFEFTDFVKQDPSTRWRVSDIEAKAFNINPLPENPYTSFDVKGELFGTTPFTVVGKAKREAKPLAWKLDAQMKNFELTAANPFLLHELPFTFASGHLDFYSEVKSENGAMSGYVKPFLREAHILPKDGKFVGVRHFFYEIAGAFANFMLKNADNKTTATKIAFHEEDGHFKVDVGDAIKGAIKNGYQKPLTPGTDDSVSFQ